MKNMINEIKNYDVNGKRVSIETIEAWMRIYCAHSCIPEDCKVYIECRSIKRV